MVILCSIPKDVVRTEHLALSRAARRRACFMRGHRSILSRRRGCDLVFVAVAVGKPKAPHGGALHEMLSHSGIYCWRTPSGLYVGSAVDLVGRRGDHLKLLRKGKHNNKFLQNAFNKHGDAFIFEILLVCDPSDLLRCEQYFIDTLKPRYNIALVAGSNLGLKMSDATREKNSIAAKRRCADPDVKARMRAAAKEQWADPAFRATREASAKAQWIDPLSRAKLIEARSTKELTDKRTAQAKRQWADPESKLGVSVRSQAFRDKMRAHAKARWADVKSQGGSSL